jgi:hypothetical protein
MGPGQTLMIYRGHYERHKKRIAELEAALKIAFAAIGVARSINAVRAEFDFDPAYDAVRNVLLPDNRN